MSFSILESAQNVAQQRVNNDEEIKKKKGFHAPNLGNFHLQD